MQWLIDMVIAAIGIPPCIVYRSVTGPDMDETTINFALAWQEWDVSAIVPEGATHMLLHAMYEHTAIAPVCYMRRSDNPEIFGTCLMRPQVVNHPTCTRRLIALSSDRKVRYRFTVAAQWTEVNWYIRGWSF